MGPLVADVVVIGVSSDRRQKTNRWRSLLIINSTTEKSEKLLVASRILPLGSMHGMTGPSTSRKSTAGNGP